jgi:hypothetical protein
MDDLEQRRSVSTLVPRRQGTVLSRSHTEINVPPTGEYNALSIDPDLMRCPSLMIA